MLSGLKKLFKKTDPQAERFKLLIHMLDGDPLGTARVEAYKELLGYGAGAKPPLLAALNQFGILGPTEFARGDMLMIVSKYPDEQVVKAINAALSHERSAVRMQALESSMNLPVEMIDENMKAKFKTLLKDKEWGIRENAKKALDRMKKKL
ncbi:MAG: hypothetical protein EHM28_09045 [Spirochaetaceae bacterium]|nr:MAG: hypothetical protein EHM28_09045 [Spirochaetaceae bacterium]